MSDALRARLEKAVMLALGKASPEGLIHAPSVWAMTDLLVAEHEAAAREERAATVAWLRRDVPALPEPFGTLLKEHAEVLHGASFCIERGEHWGDGDE